ELCTLCCPLMLQSPAGANAAEHTRELHGHEGHALNSYTARCDARFPHSSLLRACGALIAATLVTDAQKFGASPDAPGIRAPLRRAAWHHLRAGHDVLRVASFRLAARDREIGAADWRELARVCASARPYERAAETPPGMGGCCSARQAKPRDSKS